MNNQYAKQAVQAMDGGVFGNLSISNRNTSVGQNIDNRISQLQDEISRLKAVKAQLEKGNILDISLSDLQTAMGRY